MYFSYIRPILEYGDVIWDNQTQYLINKVENVQIEAMRIVTGGNKLQRKQLNKSNTCFYIDLRNQHPPFLRSTK